jgi:hypothetical protein
MCFLTHPNWVTEALAATEIYGAGACYDVIEWLQAPYVFIVEVFTDEIGDNCDVLNMDRSFYLSTEIDKILNGLANNRILKDRLTLLIPPHLSKTDEFEIERISKIYFLQRDDGEKTYLFVFQNGKKLSTDETIENTDNWQLIYDALF